MSSLLPLKPNKKNLGAIRPLLPWALVAVLSLVLLSGRRWNDLSSISSRVGFYHRPHFSGIYGADAYQRLLRWSDKLFASTMTMYKEQAMEICSPKGLQEFPGACDSAKINHRPPEPKDFDNYNLFDPYVTCPNPDAMSRIGDDGEGGKLVCTDLLERKNCVVFSLGSNGQFDFEVDILESTDCLVYTFDCTYDGKSLDQYNGRHKYLKKCIGTAAKEANDPSFITLAHAVRDLGVSEITLLKMDIEGSEYDEIASWGVEQGKFLPESMAIEIHRSEVIYMGTSAFVQTYNHAEDVLIWPLMNLDLGDLALFFGSIARMGYAIASREDNPIGRCCSEFLFLKVADWAAP
jgi:hypothetical protein